MKKSIFILTLLLTPALTLANELEKEIRYLGNNGIEERHEVVCVNNKTGIVTINMKTQEMRVKPSGASIEQNLGKATFTEAVEIICK